jgi:hypothetical protein
MSKQKQESDRKLQDDVISIKKDLAYLTKTVEEGIYGIHKRQDITNGNVIKHERQLLKIESQIPSLLTRNEYDIREKDQQIDDIRKRYEERKDDDKSKKDSFLETKKFFRNWGMQLLASILLLLLGVFLGRLF